MILPSNVSLLSGFPFSLTPLMWGCVCQSFLSFPFCKHFLTDFPTWLGFSCLVCVVVILIVSLMGFRISVLTALCMPVREPLGWIEWEDLPYMWRAPFQALGPWTEKKKAKASWAPAFISLSF